jgi:prepilin-type N-terminal cleavage/methylation domain-containing protein
MGVVRMLKHRGGICRRVLLRSSVGFTLVEVVVAIALLALVVGGVLTTMVVVFNMQTHQDQQRIGEYLTRNAFEYIKTQPYIWGNVTSSPTQKGYPPYYDPVPSTESYYLDIVAIPIDKDSYLPLDVLPGPRVDDQGIQEIIISVYSGLKAENSAPVLVTTNYKVAR